GAGEHPAHVALGESEPDVSHLLLVLDTIVRQHVDDERATARFEHACRLGEGTCWVGQVMEHQRHHHDVDSFGVDRHRFEAAETDVDVPGAAQPATRRLQHVGGV